MDDRTHQDLTKPGDAPGFDPSRRLWAIMHLERRDLLALVLYSLVVALLALALPVAIQALVNTAGFSSSPQPIVSLTLLVFVGLAMSGVLQAVQVHLVEVLRRRIFVRVAADLAWRLPRANIAAFDRHHGPEVVNRFFDVLTLQKSATTLLLDGLATVVQVPIGLALIALYHPAFLAYGVLVALSIAVIVRLLGRDGRSSAIAESKAKYAVASWLEEVARHPLAFKSEGGEAAALGRVDNLLVRFLDERDRHFRVVMRQLSALLALQAVASASLLGLGGWLVAQGQLGLGQFVATEFILVTIVGSFAKLGKHLEAYYDLEAAMDKLGHLWDLPLEPAGHTRLPVAQGPLAVTCAGVSFAYPGGPPLLADLDLTLLPGERVGIMGGNGAGKSTLLDLLYRLRVPLAGAIQFDGMSTSALAPAEVRRHVELVREIEVFEGTVFENVRMGRAEVGEPEIRRALAAVGLIGRVEALEASVQTALATGGGPLSPGEARRLVLARALAGAPRLLLLDEVLANLDLAAQPQILDHLFDPSAGHTLVAVTSNPHALARCHRVLELRGGNLHELPDGRSRTARP